MRYCCHVDEYGQAFTPTRNSITTVPLNFTMTANHNPLRGDYKTIAASDLVALELLAPGVPFPGIWPNGGGPITEMPNFLYIPAPSVNGVTGPSGSRKSDTSYSGFQPTYNIDFRSAGNNNSLNSAGLLAP